jgi:hypothetical protein
MRVEYGLGMLTYYAMAELILDLRQDYTGNSRSAEQTVGLTPGRDQQIL